MGVQQIWNLMYKSKETLLYAQKADGNHPNKSHNSLRRFWS